jgi:predicted nucleic acid-binding protein
LADRETSPSYVLNTRPILNVLGIDRVDLLALVLGRAVHVGPTVLREVREHVAWTVRDLETRARRRPESIQPVEIAYVDNLRRWDVRLAPPLVRRVGLEYDELEHAQRLMRAGRLDPGESEVLAIARHRGWVAVTDEMAAHRQAESDGIPNESTLGLLVGAVREGHLESQEAASLSEIAP